MRERAFSLILAACLSAGRRSEAFASLIPNTDCRNIGQKKPLKCPLPPAHICIFYYCDDVCLIQEEVSFKFLFFNPKRKKTAVANMITLIA
jgi:hypothetical protein